MRLATPLALALVLSGLPARAQTPPPEPSPEVVEAGRLFDSGDFAGAARAYQALVQARPQATGLRVRLAASLHQQGKHAEALAALEEAHKAGPNPAALAWTARAEARLGRKDAALASLQAAVKNGYIDLATLDGEADFSSLRPEPRFKEIREAAGRNAHPCVSSPEARQLDFWLGDWDVTVGGVRAGQSRVEKILNDCVVLENWTGASGYVGKSFNLYDRQKKRWQQTWVDGLGGVTEYFGEWKDGALRYEAKGIVPAGEKDPADQTMVFFKRDDGRVRQLIQQTRDGGKTWSVVFDGFYAKRK
jgi:tetratricopeptide (TPR) repeat protein